MRCAAAQDSSSSRQFSLVGRSVAALEEGRAEQGRLGRSVFDDLKEGGAKLFDVSGLTTPGTLHVVLRAPVVMIY